MTASAATPSSPQPGAPRTGKPQASGARRRWPYVGGAVLIALIVAGLLPKPVSVEKALVTRGELRVMVEEEGRTRVKNRYVVAAPVAGHMRRIDLKPGAPVVAGSTVLTVLETSGADLLDARSLAQAAARVRGAEAARDQAAAREEGARASAALARSEHERVQALFSQMSISRQELDVAATRARTTVEESRAAEFGSKIAAFELEQTRALLVRGKPESAENTEGLPMLSPISGRVLRVFQESARNVVSGTPLLELGEPTDLEIIIEVLSRDGVAIAEGTRVLLEQWGGAKPLEARVRLVEPSAFTKISALGVEEQRVNVIADFIDAAEQRPTLGDAYRVEARIVVWESADTITVPTGALFQRGGKWHTFVVDGGHARLRAVKVGRTNGTRTQILEGVSVGEGVVVYPGDSVVDGRKVEKMGVD